MTAFTKRDIKNLLEDLKLYSGNIMKITGIHGPHTGNGGGIGGVIHTWMDSYKFSADPMFCDEETWCIHLSDPVESLRRGHRHIKFFCFPKIHKNPRQQARYEIANTLYKAYNSYSNVTEASRLAEYEKMLGYHKLASYMEVLEAIVRDFRSHKEKQNFLHVPESFRN